MEDAPYQPLLIQEKRLVSTMITGRPSPQSYTIALSTVLLMALITLFYWYDPLNWSQFLAAENHQVFHQGQWWRVFTAIFIHADINHFLSNMYMLGIFSFFVFGYFGFGVYPLLSFVAAGAVNALAILSYADDVTLLGASGLVYILGAFWLTLYFLIQRQYHMINRLMRVLGIGFVIFAPTTFVPTTSYRTHAIGFAVGILMGLIYFYKNKRLIRSHEVYKMSLIEEVLDDQSQSLRRTL